MAVKLIKHTSDYDHPDDPSLPFKLEVTLRPPEFLEMTWVGLYGGSEDIVARGDSAEELLAWADENGLKDHIRLRRYSITDSEGKVVESWDRENNRRAIPVVTDQPKPYNS